MLAATQHVSIAIFLAALSAGVAVHLFANADMSKLDAAVCRVSRSAWRVPQRTQTALVLRGREDAGVGQQSMMVDYVQILASSLTQALNDKGPLGESTRALLKWQQRAMGGQQTAGADYDRLGKFLARKLRPMHLVWQLGLLRRHGVVLQGPAGFDLEISGDCLAALRPQESADQPQSEVCRSITKYLTDLCGCCVGEQPFTLTRMDMAVTRVGEHPMMRPLSHVRLLCGGELADKHRHAYNRLTTLLNTGEVTTSQRARDLPELDRLVSEEAALARFCACDLEDLEEEADVLATDAVPRVMPGQAPPLPASGYEKGLRDLYEKQSKAETRLRSKAALKQVSAPAPAKEQDKRARSESEAPRRSVRLAGLPERDYDQSKDGSQLFALKEPPVVVPEPFRMLPPHPREAELAANRFSSFEHYREWLTHSGGDVGTLVCLYDPDYGYASVLGEKLDRHRQLLYLMRMQPCPVRRVHLPCLHEAGRLKSASLLETETRDPHHPQAMY